jgi:hypothetical protein
MIKAGAGKKDAMSPSSGVAEGNLLDDDFEDDSRQTVSGQIERVEELLRKLQLVKRERQQVLKDLKEKVRSPLTFLSIIANVSRFTPTTSATFSS